MYVCVLVYVSINACVKRAIIQSPLTREVFLFTLSLSLKKALLIQAEIHSEFSQKGKKSKKTKTSIYTFKPIHSNDCHFNHNEPSVSGVCPFIITLIQC